MKQRIVLLLVCLCVAVVPITAQAVNKPDWPLEVLSWDIDKAYPGIEYNYRVAVKGGEYPYQFTLVEGPSGMTINKKTGEILWTPASSLTDTVVVRISDMAGNSLVHQFDITSTKTGFYFVDGAKGSDTANTGSESSPWKTMKHASVTADSSGYVYVKAGTYHEALVITKTNCGRFIAYPGHNVNMIGAGTGHHSFEFLGGEKRIVQGFNLDGSGLRWIFSVQGSCKHIVWRKNDMRNVHDIVQENPSFIFFWDQGTPYTNMVIQDNVFHDLRDPSFHHGASVTYYAVENSLYEDNHAYDIDGDGVDEKTGGRRNTFRNNIFNDIRRYQAVRLNSNPYSEFTEICYNLIYNCSQGIQIGSNGTHVSNIFVHHNTCLSNIIFQEYVIAGDQSYNINIYNNIIGIGSEYPYTFSPSGDDSYPEGFQSKVGIDNNIVFGRDDLTKIAGNTWGITPCNWAQWQDKGMDVNSIPGNPGLDSNYSLPSDSPYRGNYGRDLSDANHAPVLAPIGNRSVSAGERIQFTVQGSDADGNQLHYSATGNP